MSTYWLNGKLRGHSDIRTDGQSPILKVSFGDKSERIYCPDANEYRVTADVVKKAQALGATIVVYSSSWGSPTYEGERFGEKNGIAVMSYAKFFSYLRSHGIKIEK